MIPVLFNLYVSHSAKYDAISGAIPTEISHERNYCIKTDFYESMNINRNKVMFWTQGLLKPFCIDINFKTFFSLLWRYSLAVSCLI